MFSERVRVYLSDIVADAARVMIFVDGLTAEMLVQDDRTWLAVERLFQRITEAVIQIGPDDLARLAGDLPFRQMRDFGNRLRHDYRNIDPATILDIARDNLPALRDAAARALES